MSGKFQVLGVSDSVFVQKGYYIKISLRLPFNDKTKLIQVLKWGVTPKKIYIYKKKIERKNLLVFASKKVFFYLFKYLLKVGLRSFFFTFN